MAQQFLVSSGDQITPYYVFFFRNIFQPRQGIDSLLSVKSARELILNLFRIHECQVKKSEVLKMLENKYSWMTTDTSVLPRDEFDACCISALIWFMRNMLHLHVSLHFSKDKQKIICLIGACESVYKEIALREKYRLRLEDKKEWDLGNQQLASVFSVSGMMPKKIAVTEQVRQEVKKKWEFKKCAPSTQYHRAQNPDQDFQHYDENDKLTDKHITIFPQIDKIRLLVAHFDQLIPVHLWKEEKLILHHFCLHDHVALHRLREHWTSVKSFLGTQPIDEIRSYYGEEVGLYFAWLGHLTLWLGVPAVLGAGLYIALGMWSNQINLESTAEQGLVTSFAVMLSIWATLQVKFWVRKEKEYSWRWATQSQNTREDDLRYDGNLALDPITMKIRKVRPDLPQETHSFLSPKIVDLGKQTASVAVMAVFIFAVVAAVYAIFIYRESIRERPYSLTICGIITGIQIFLFNKVESYTDLLLGR